ncbi:uncharacterized protein LOC125757881 [Rhipicephalus sanguineus]|uniref:G-protein coupled receptors family 2 profile 2 domain-containing protein n=1 Tax=Rhipicephalus sanguineus TaxID=34632 RepID=A0A9D4Q1P8_RHISA|nr:uncharacterized protein LOC125757881 [Rhipicephalus sanguineus]KAH7962796.1 hypothetical protein HPB52_017995 [Rhipicephalus sanguineus]
MRRCSTSIARLLCALSATFLKPGGVVAEECNATLPWTVSRDTYEDIEDVAFESLMWCPANLHGCSNDLLSCEPGTYVVTCSCAPNCRVYRDCCWDVEFLPEDETEFPEISCVPVQVSTRLIKHVSMVVGCLPSWPQDEVRTACENGHSFNEDFHHIPATSINHVTYRNGFCALCNNDVANATFWDAMSMGPRKPVRALLPQLVSGDPELYLRPCVSDKPDDACDQHVGEHISDRCKTYYAPVSDAENPYYPIYRNVYCATCNGANVSRLSCSQTRQVSNFTIPWRRHPTGEKRPASARPPNLAAIFKPVVSTPTCYAEHDGHCYIREAPNLKKKDLLTLRRGNRFTNGTKPTHPVGGHNADASPNAYFNVYNYVTVICMSVSVCCLALKVVVFCAYKGSRSFSSKCTLCLSVTLMITQLLYLLTSFVDVHGVACVVVAVLVHYGFLSTFCWTGVLSYDICSNVTSVKLSSARDRTLALYATLSWSLPLVIVASALLVHWLTPDSEVSPRYGTVACWIGTLLGLVLYFLVPMATLTLFSLFVYLKTVFYIHDIASDAAGVREGQNGNASADCERKRHRTRMALFCRLALIMGAAWMVAFLGTFVPFAEIDVVVNFLVGLQGVYLFVAFKDYRYIWASIAGRQKVAVSGSRGTSQTIVASPKKSCTSE